MKQEQKSNSITAFSFVHEEKPQEFKFLPSLANIPFKKNDTNTIYSKVQMALSQPFITRINELTT